MTHLTGGLEASVLAHSTANTMLTLTLILAGGTWSTTTMTGPVLLLPLAAMLLVTGLIGWRERRRRA